MKKILIILVSAVLIFSLVGCSANGLNYYKTIKEMSNLGSFTFEGETSLEINTEVKDQDKADLNGIEEIQAVQAVVNGAKILYNGKINDENKTLEFHLSLEMLDPTTEDEKDTVKIDVLNIKAEGEYLYVDKDTLDAFVTSMTGDPIGDTGIPEETIEGVAYYKLDMKTVVEGMFESIEDSILYIDAMPEIDSEETNVYYSGYYDGFYGAVTDFELESTDYETAYIEESMAGLTTEEITEYKGAYDAGYLAGKQAAEDEHTQDLADVESLEQYKAPMLENANAVYLINAIKNIMLKGEDKMINDLFDEFSLDLVKKTDDSTYNLHLDGEDMKDAAIKIIDYLNDNSDKTVTVFKEFLLSLTNEDLILLGINPDELQTSIESMEENLPFALDMMDDPAYIDSQFDFILYNANISYDSTIKKSGYNAFDVTDIFNIDLTEDTIEDSGFALNATLTNKLYINKASQGDILTQSNTGDNSISLNTTDKNAKGCGILYSLSQDMSNPTRLAGVKQSDGSYLVNVSALKSGTKYFYQMYTVDGTDNIVYSANVQNITTVSANPGTGDSAAIIWSVLALGSVALCYTLRKRSARAHQQ